MSNDYQRDLIQYRLARARETYQEALLMYREKHWNVCANRWYYACFYAVNALFIRTGYASSKHAGVRSLFNQHVVKPVTHLKLFILITLSDRPYDFCDSRYSVSGQIS